MIEAKGIKALDALHIASAEAIESVYFLTTDEEILKKGYRYSDFFKQLKIRNPIVFLTEVL
jgi:hypothetical protein